MTVGLVVISMIARADAAPASAPDAAAASVTAPSPSAQTPLVLITPWPATLPCARPSTVWFDARFSSTVIWSSADGTETHSFVTSTGRSETGVPRGFPTGRLTRLTGQASVPDSSGVVAGLGCRGDPDIEIVWGPCPGGACAVSTTYPGGLLPRARQRTRYWTDQIAGSPWADTAPDVHWSRFLRDIGRKNDGDVGATRESLRFSRAFVIELRDTLAKACGVPRCAALVHEADRALAFFLRDRAPTRSRASQRDVDHWNYVWSWTVTASGVSIDISCDDMTESPDMLCDLSIDLPGEVRLGYGTFHRDVELYATSDAQQKHRLGGIACVGSDRRPAIAIDGRLLELREAAPLPAK